MFERWLLQTETLERISELKRSATFNSSIWRREKGTLKQKKFLSKWSVSEPKNYLSFLNEQQTKEEEETIEKSIQRDCPYGEESWVSRVVREFGLESTVRAKGRPKKGD